MKTITVITWIKPGRAAHILGVGTPVLHTYADAGRLTRDEHGYYDAAEVRALRETRDREREERRAAREQRARDRVRRAREQERAAKGT